MIKKFLALLSVFLLGVNAEPQVHLTNTIHSWQEQQFPLSLPGHYRYSNEPCLQEADIQSRMITQHLSEEKENHRAETRKKGLSPINKPYVSDLKCINNKAGDYDCKNIDLLSFVPISELGSTREASDIWGWQDPKTGDEIAIICMEDSTAFVQITDPYNPVVLGNLKQSGSFNRIWADVKVYANHAYIIREVDHGVQVFDLTKLREFYNLPSVHARQLTDDYVYRDQGITSTHNIAINEETAFAYAVGTKTCRGGLHVIDISEPKKPTFAGCFSDDNYVHDSQVVIYRGPDTKYFGREIAFSFNENTLTIVDVSDKSDMKMLSRTDYERNFYVHQGWLTEDMKFIISNDELDEKYSSNEEEKYTRTLFWNVSNLEQPKLIATHTADVQSIDHNLYIKDDKAYLSNYVSGLRILDSTNLNVSTNGTDRELGYFDTSPEFSGVQFNGAWSNFPYFETGSIIVSDIEKGLFVLRYNKTED